MLLSSVPKYFNANVATTAAGNAPKHKCLTIFQCTLFFTLCAMVPADLVMEAKARSVPTATAGLTPNSRVNKGVINDPPPTPVRPTSNPTANPDAT